METEVWLSRISEEIEAAQQLKVTSCSLLAFQNLLHVFCEQTNERMPNKIETVAKFVPDCYRGMPESSKEALLALINSDEFDWKQRSLETLFQRFPSVRRGTVDLYQLCKYNNALSVAASPLVHQADSDYPLLQMLKSEHLIAVSATMPVPIEVPSLDNPVDLLAKNEKDKGEEEQKRVMTFDYSRGETPYFCVQPGYKVRSFDHSRPYSFAVLQPKLRECSRKQWWLNYHRFGQTSKEVSRQGDAFKDFEWLALEWTSIQHNLLRPSDMDLRVGSLMKEAAEQVTQHHLPMRRLNLLGEFAGGGFMANSPERMRRQHAALQIVESFAAENRRKQKKKTARSAKNDKKNAALALERGARAMLVEAGRMDKSERLTVDMMTRFLADFKIQKPSVKDAKKRSNLLLFFQHLHKSKDEGKENWVQIARRAVEQSLGRLKGGHVDGAGGSSSDDSSSSSSDSNEDSDESIGLLKSAAAPSPDSVVASPTSIGARSLSLSPNKTLSEALSPPPADSSSPARSSFGGSMRSSASEKTLPEVANISGEQEPPLDPPGQWLEYTTKALLLEDAWKEKNLYSRFEEARLRHDRRTAALEGGKRKRKQVVGTESAAPHPKRRRREEGSERVERPSAKYNIEKVVDHTYKVSLTKDNTMVLSTSSGRQIDVQG
jgi:hypothetical protein